MAIQVEKLQDGLPFGARVSGVTRESLADEAVRGQLREVFEDRGLIVFANVEQTSQMHVALSNVFGPLKDHPVPTVARVDNDVMPGVIDMRHDPQATANVEIDGRPLCSWLPWHFDHCYNNELNRAGVLRAVTVAGEGGLTLFADGIQLWQDFSPELRARIEDKNVLYTVNTAFKDMRFGRPETMRVLHPRAEETELIAFARTMPRAVHPAVWSRKEGEKVLHVSPWMAVGLEGHEDPEGDALLEAVSQEIAAKAVPYTHHWTTDDMLIWDNWRMMHAVTGIDPGLSRRMQRTTIRGDYGLGYFENGGVGGHEVLEMTV